MIVALASPLRMRLGAEIQFAGPADIVGVEVNRYHNVIDGEVSKDEVSAISYVKISIALTYPQRGRLH